MVWHGAAAGVDAEPITGYGTSATASSVAARTPRRAQVNDLRATKPSVPAPIVPGLHPLARLPAARRN